MRVGEWSAALARVEPFIDPSRRVFPMPLDLSTLSPNARAGYQRIGRQYGSTDTLAQSNQTLDGLAEHGAELVQHGFVAADGQRLTDARDALVTAGVGRNEARGDKKVTSAELAAALKSGKAARGSARAVLVNTRRALFEKVDPAAQAAVQQLDVALQQTNNAGSDAGKLADQLDLIRGALAEPTVAAEAAPRGGPQAVSELTSHAALLRAAAAARTTVPGTPAETEHLDVIDGIIVTLARHARQAARSAAKRLGKPALLADFELTRLYDPPTAGAPGKTPDKTPAPPPPDAPPGG